MQRQSILPSQTDDIDEKEMPADIVVDMHVH